MYTVSNSDLSFRKDYKTPTNAINAWMREQKNSPMDVQIDATTKDEVIELRRFVKKYADWFKQTHEELSCPYKLDFLMNQVENPEELEGCEYTMDLPSYPVAPFTVG